MKIKINVISFIVRNYLAKYLFCPHFYVGVHAGPHKINFSISSVWMHLFLK